MYVRRRDIPPSVLDGVMCHNESNRATTVVCCGGAVRVVMFDILYGSVYLKLNVGKWVASVTTEPGNLS